MRYDMELLGSNYVYYNARLDVLFTSYYKLNFLKGLNIYYIGEL